MSGFVTKKNRVSTKWVLIIFTLLLVQTSFAQVDEKLKQTEQAVTVEVLSQTDSPVLITFLNVENSALSYQSVNYTIQNLSDKPIRGLVILHDGATASIFLNKLFQSGQVIYSETAIERNNIKRKNTVTLSVDYVEFMDGSSWGSDTRKLSEIIAGTWEGQKQAIGKLREIIKNNDSEALTKLLEQEITELIVPTPDKGKSDTWQRGFRTGYRGIISTFQRQQDKQIKTISEKLDEMEKA